VFLICRHILATLVGVIVPIMALVLTTVELAGRAGYLDGLTAGIGGAFSTGVHLAFWVTLTFVFLERAEVAREARTEIVAATGPRRSRRGGSTSRRIWTPASTCLMGPVPWSAARPPARNGNGFGRGGTR